MTAPPDRRVRWTTTGCVGLLALTAAWPSFSLIAADELLMRQVRRRSETDNGLSHGRQVKDPPLCIYMVSIGCQALAAQTEAFCPVPAIQWSSTWLRE